MTSSFTGLTQLIDKWTHKDADNVSEPTDDQRYIHSTQWAYGSGDNQIQDHFRIQGSVSPGEGNDDEYDLAGALTNVFGETLTFTEIRKLIIVNLSTTDGENLRVGGNGAATTGALITDIFDGDDSAGLIVKASGFGGFVAPLGGYTITGGSADVLVVTNRGTAAITYDLIIGGVTS